MSEGSRRRLAFVTEVTPGTTPDTGWKVLRSTGGASIVDARQAINSAEYRQDRGVGTPRLGNSTPQMNIPFELSFGTYDELLESALQGSWALNVLKQGTSKKYFSFEEGFMDMATPQFQVMRGALCTGMDLNVAPNAMITGSFRFLGLGASAFSPTPAQATAYDAATESVPFDSFNGEILEGGSAIAVVTALSLSLDNGAAHMFSVFAKDPNRVVTGRANLTGNISAFFDDVTLANKYLNETETSLRFTLEDPDGNDYEVYLPKVKYMGATRELTENNIQLNMPFQAFFDDVSGTTVQITRVAI